LSPEGKGDIITYTPVVRDSTTSGGAATFSWATEEAQVASEHITQKHSVSTGPPGGEPQMVTKTKPHQHTTLAPNKDVNRTLPAIGNSNIVLYA